MPYTKAFCGVGLVCRTNTFLMETCSGPTVGQGPQWLCQETMLHTRSVCLNPGLLPCLGSPSLALPIIRYSLPIPVRVSGSLRVAMSPARAKAGLAGMALLLPTNGIDLSSGEVGSGHCSRTRRTLQITQPRHYR